MAERELKNNYIVALVKFFLFLIIFCFLTEFIRYFIRAIQSTKGLSFNVLVGAAISVFGVYLFLIDLNGAYKKIQRFFFRSKFFSCLLPSILIVLALSYFFVPKIFNISFSKNIFVFLGGASLFVHLIYVARENKGKSFQDLTNYFFVFSILIILSMILFGFYLKIGFNFKLGDALLLGMQDGVDLIKKIFVQSFR